MNTQHTCRGRQTAASGCIRVPRPTCAGGGAKPVGKAPVITPTLRIVNKFCTTTRSRTAGIQALAKPCAAGWLWLAARCRAASLIDRRVRDMDSLNGAHPSFDMTILVEAKIFHAATIASRQFQGPILTGHAPRRTVRPARRYRTLALVPLGSSADRMQGGHWSWSPRRGSR